jgi:hypothetical protein
MAADIGAHYGLLSDDNGALQGDNAVLIGRGVTAIQNVALAFRSVAEHEMTPFPKASVEDLARASLAEAMATRRIAAIHADIALVSSRSVCAH